MTVSKSISTELLDSLLSGYQKPEDLIGENGLLKGAIVGIAHQTFGFQIEYLFYPVNHGAGRFSFSGFIDG